MSNETKRDVFEDLVEELANAYIALDGEGLGDDLTNEDKQAYLKDYDDALPDDLPVIPEAISDAIKFYWTTYGSEKGLTDLLFDLVEPWRIDVEKVVYAIHEDTRKYYLLHSDVIARAWVLGVWRVEETGEVVKL
ncbi:hypothetical protein ABC627_05130 [Lacticaseibacillus paracasei]|uniref:hypothetical protein n=1 Tax=Lacticaseibacillus paracasei TaxID=1597 RepID=UPI0031D1DFAB